MPDLTKRIKAREERIEAACEQVATGVNQSVTLAFEQGDDLIAFASQTTEQEFGTLIRETFSQSARAQGYMKLAARTPLTERHAIIADAKLLKQAMRTLDLLPEEPTTSPESKSVSIPPIIQRLTWLAEWTGRNQDAVRDWKAEQRAELKQQLAPVVELYGQL